MGWQDDIYAEALAGRTVAGAKLRKEATAQVVVAAPAQIIRQSRKGPNKTEKRFLNEYLEPMRHAGEIDQIDDHESITLRLANGLRLSPDFPTWKDGRLTFFEVKGERIFEDSLVKLKCAANKFPHVKFILCKYVKGEWIKQEVLP